MGYSTDVVGSGSSSRNLLIRRIWSYFVLTLFAIIALLPFFFLIINLTRSHSQIQKGFSVVPGNYIFKNFKKVMQNGDWKMLNSLFNSFLISSLTALLSTYFSALTAYAIHVYDFKLKKFAFTFILVIMMIPAQVSALGFVKLVTNMGLLDSFIPLIIPAIAAPATFFFMKQW